MTLAELLAADPSALRHSDWVELQRLAREWNAALDADKKDAARMREVDALVGAGMVDRLASWVVDDNARHDPKYASWAEKSEGHRDRVRSVVGRVLTAFAAALLTDGAVEAFDNGYDNAFAPELDRFRAGIRAAIRAAGVEPPTPNDRAAENQALADKAEAGGAYVDFIRPIARRAGLPDTMTTSQCVVQLAETARLEKARADKAESERDVAVNRAGCLAHNYRGACDERDQVLASMPTDEQIADWKKAEATLAALEAVIAETSHAAGISGTMTPAARVRAMGNTIGDVRLAAENLAAEMKTRGEGLRNALRVVERERDALAIDCGSASSRMAAIEGARDIAKAEADALRAEVAALRGLGRNTTAVATLVDAAAPCGSRVSQEGNTAFALRQVIATVPPAKVADAVPPQCADGHRYRNGMSDSDETCCYMCGFEPLPTGDGANAATDGDVAAMFAPKPRVSRLATDAEVEAASPAMTAAAIESFPTSGCWSRDQQNQAARGIGWLIRSVVALQNDGGAPKPEAAGLEREQRVDTTTEAIQRGFDALAKWGRHNSAHEGFAVLLEEVDELKAHVWTKQKNRDLAAMRSEAIDVAAVALRFADELCTEERGRR